MGRPDPPRPRVALVTGGTGAVGPALVDHLLRDGHRVRVLSRGDQPAPRAPDTVSICHGDVTDPGAVARAVEGVDWVFHLAARLHVLESGPSVSTQYERVNVEGTRVVTEQAAGAGASRLVLFSTIAVYGPTGPTGADEDTPPWPDSPYAETKLRAEGVVRSAEARGELSASILRLAAVYGPRMRGNYARLARAMASGWFLPVGSGLNRRTLVHEDDVAEAALLVARAPRAAGRLYNVSDGQVHQLRKILEAISRALGRSAPRLTIPLGLARAGAQASDFSLAALGRRRRLARALDKYTEDVAVRSDRIRTELGFCPKLGLDEGWRNTLREIGRPVSVR